MKTDSWSTALTSGSLILYSLRWSNIPIPEGYVIPLMAGVVLHIFFPRRFFGSPWLKHVLGWPFLLLGTLITACAVMAIKGMDIKRPTRIIVSGPYRFSRNPMYVAWTLIYVGIAILVNSWWLFILLPVILVFTHYIVVRREEQRLEQVFGEEYRQYRDNVRRYL